MNDTQAQVLTKQEWEYLNTIEKQNTLLEKLKQQSESNKTSLEVQKTEIEKLTTEKNKLDAEINTLTKELSELKPAYELMAKELETVKGAHELMAKELTELKSTHEPLKADLEETTKESQAHVDNIECQNDDLLKQIEDLKEQVLTSEEMLFFQGCKADIILAELFQQKKILNLRDLREKKFPMTLLEPVGNEPSGVTTTNFRLIRTGVNAYQLFKI